MALCLNLITTLFFYIKNPSAKVKLAAVTRDGYNLFFIKVRSKKIKLAALNAKNNPYPYPLSL